jgi:hypothetical protein
VYPPVYSPVPALPELVIPGLLLAGSAGLVWATPLL